jgi:hypothetical protein
MNPLIISNKWIEQVAKSQGIQWDRATRIIIDAKMGEPVYMYVTQLGDDRILTLHPPDVLPAEVSERAE